MPSVILTRSVEENLRIAPLFESVGLSVRSAPMIQFVARRPTDSEVAAIGVDTAFAVLLTSAHATRLWIDVRTSLLRERTITTYLVVGERSARLIQEADPDVPVSVVADSAEDLIGLDLTGIRLVLYPCSAARRDEAVDGLVNKGIDVVELPLYAPAMPASARDDLHNALLDAPSPFAVCFFSPSAATNCFSLHPDIPDGAIFVAIGPTTASALEELGVERVIVSDRPDAGSMAECIARHFRNL